MAEMHRVLRPGGHAVLSVPNLASLHNRALLALGRQPTSIRTFGPHVRGYAFGEFCAFVERGGAYEIERRLSAGFYPLLARPGASRCRRFWRSAGHTTIVLARKITGARALARLHRRRSRGRDADLLRHLVGATPFPLPRTQSTATSASISTRTPFGSAATPTATRAGGSTGKKAA